MKCFIGKIAVIFIWVVVFFHLINIWTNGKDDFYITYTNVEIIENINKDHITWQGINPNGEVELFTVEYCKKCGQHFENGCGYTLEEISTGTVTEYRCDKLAWYLVFLIPFIFLSGIPFVIDEGLEWNERENIVRNCLIFGGYDKEKINKSFNIIQNMKLKTPLGCSYKFEYSLGELFKTTINEYNKLT